MRRTSSAVDGEIDELLNESQEEVVTCHLSR